MSKQAEENGRLFGTSGIRGVVGSEISPELCRDVGRALGTSLSPDSSVCLATDTRESREQLKGAVISGLLSTGTDVVDLGILPTPALALLTRETDFASGIMLTASHNPPEYNGIKLFNKDATGYSEDQERRIEQLYSQRRFREGKGILERRGDGRERYLSFLSRSLPPRGANRDLKLVVDPGNGAASGFASYVFAKLGLKVLPFNDEPDGSFPGRNPEPREDTLTATVRFLRENDADLAVCFDGDADRVVFCDREGFLGFNEMVAFISRLAVREQGKKKVATTVEAGKLLDLAIADLGAEVVRGKVGDVHVAYLARECDAALGVEQVGVYIAPWLGYYPDSLFAPLFLLSHLSNVGEIRSYFRSIPGLFFEKSKIPCPNELKRTVMAQLTGKVPDFEPTQVNDIDGLRLEFSDAWMLIRPSGTEPAVRVIAESTSRSQVDELMKKGTGLVQSLLEVTS